MGDKLATGYDRRACPECGKPVIVNKDNSLRTHRTGKGPCPGGRPGGSHSGVETKAAAYLAQGRVHVVGEDMVLVNGSKPEPYIVSWTGITWVCNCEARVWRCTHVVCAMEVRPELVPRHDLKADEPDPEVDALLGVERPEAEGLTAKLMASIDSHLPSSEELDALLK